MDSAAAARKRKYWPLMTEASAGVVSWDEGGVGLQVLISFGGIRVCLHVQGMATGQLRNFRLSATDSAAAAGKNTS